MRRVTLFAVVLLALPVAAGFVLAGPGRAPLPSGRPGFAPSRPPAPKPPPRAPMPGGGFGAFGGGRTTPPAPRVPGGGMMGGGVYGGGYGGVYGGGYTGNPGPLPPGQGRHPPRGRRPSPPPRAPGPPIPVPTPTPIPTPPPAPVPPPPIPYPPWLVRQWVTPAFPDTNGSTVRRIRFFPDGTFIRDTYVDGVRTGSGASGDYAWDELRRELTLDDGSGRVVIIPIPGLPGVPLGAIALDRRTYRPGSPPSPPEPTPETTPPGPTPGPTPPATPGPTPVPPVTPPPRGLLNNAGAGVWGSPGGDRAYFFDKNGNFGEMVRGADGKWRPSRSGTWRYDPVRENLVLRNGEGQVTDVIRVVHIAPGKQATLDGDPWRWIDPRRL